MSSRVQLLSLLFARERALTLNAQMVNRTVFIHPPEQLDTGSWRFAGLSFISSLARFAKGFVPRLPDRLGHSWLLCGDCTILVLPYGACRVLRFRQRHDCFRLSPVT